MKKSIYLCTMILFLILSRQASAYSIALTPSAQTINQGETAWVDVDLSIAPEEELFGFDFDLTFDQNILSFENIWFNQSLAGYLTGFDSPTPADPDISFNGALDLFTLSGLTEGDFTLATLSFTGLNPGTSALSLSGDILDMAAVDLLPAAAEGSVSVPEPGILLLLGAGLAGLAGIRKKEYGR